MPLSASAGRVLGSLVEKELSTPDQYPLTLKALTAACNQISNRESVVDYDEITVMSTLNSLKQERLIRFVLPSHGRTAVRYRHVLDEALGLDKRQCALLAVLLLRGPQTLGELRSRTDRMTQFDSLAEVEHELALLAAVAEPLAVNLGRRPGQKEERWMSPLASDTVLVHESDRPAAAVAVATVADASSDLVRNAVDRMDAGDHSDAGDHTDAAALGDLRSDIAALRAEVSALRRDLDSLRTSLGE
jgi:uncharacterized protein YceH (UPF0502 family)